MKLSAPTNMMFLISLVLAIVAVLAVLVPILAILKYAFWIAVAGYAVLAVGCLFKGV